MSADAPDKNEYPRASSKKIVILGNGYIYNEFFSKKKLPNTHFCVFGTQTLWQKLEFHCYP